MKIYFAIYVTLCLALGAVAIAETEPEPVPVPPKMLTFEEVLSHQRLFEEKREEYLSQNGWTRGTDTPGKFFYWQVTYKGVEYRLEADQAIYVQRGISEEREQEALERQLEQSIGIQ